MSVNYVGIYDFELMPYALGDVLTWNVQTAIGCENSGHKQVDIHICMDDRYPASIYQRGMITAANCGLFFNELFGAFGTHPLLGGLYVYRDRDEMRKRLHAVGTENETVGSVLHDYEHALANRSDEAALNAYFMKYIYFHEQINAFALQHGRIPLLRASLGCGPDIDGLIANRLAGKRIVMIHVRLRRLDAGYGGEHTYTRDSDFLEWYEFLSQAARRYPEVQFVVLGRLQEKPLAFLRLPNVLSLRTLGLGIGHELTLMLHSDLFMGTSSGFAAMANFSALPYFITKMNVESCNAYRIAFGAPRLPFATKDQLLVYETESCALLMRLLEQGLAVSHRRDESADAEEPPSSVQEWERARARWLHPQATTSRFYVTDDYSDMETAYLVLPRIEQASTAWREGREEAALDIVARIEDGFPRLYSKLPEFRALADLVSVHPTRAGRSPPSDSPASPIGPAHRISGQARRTGELNVSRRSSRLQRAWESRGRLMARSAAMLRQLYRSKKKP